MDHMLFEPSRRYGLIACGLVLAGIAACKGSRQEPTALTTAGAGGASSTTAAGSAASSGGAGARATTAAGSGGSSVVATAGQTGAAGASSDTDDAGTSQPPTNNDPVLSGPFTAAELESQHCAPSRPGFAYRAGRGSNAATAAKPAEGALAPIPCATNTDVGSTESTLGITKDGNVFFAPAFKNEGVGLLRSADFGASWQFVEPKLENGSSHGRMQPYVYVDPTTDRIFFATTASAAPMAMYSGGFDLSISSDAGKTFTSSNLASDTFDWIKIFAGPPRTSTTQNYPNIVYASAPSPISTPIPIVSLVGLAPQYQSIYRSLDGGHSWERAATPSLLASDVPGCAASNEWVIYGAGAVDESGTAYLVVRRCRKLAVAVSSDEGSTWNLHEIPGVTLPPFDTSNLLQIVANPNLLVTEQLAVDGAGAVYLAWIDAEGGLRFAYSRDAAQTWSTPVTVAAPEVTDVRYAGLATRGSGVLAIAYYGSTDGVKYNGYVTETSNAFDEEPLFMSVVLNDPADPLFPWGFEVGYLGVTNGSDLHEIIQAKYAPNGDLWVSLVKDMCESATTTRCHWDTAAHAGSPYQGVVGRMIHGVSSRWSEAHAADPDRFKTTCEQSPDNEQQCDAIASGENICEELASCVCTSCACSILDCKKDSHCDAVRQCATKNNCRGIDCILSCQDVALEAGELMTTRALGVANCLTAHECPASCPPF
ncbi:MAG TPA: sialidase family protein [Polyangiales bacterium]|nr:sialidase family protein [Polyangiales bacterium]